MTRTVQVRHVPDDVHRTLRIRATASGRSLSDYLLEEITRVARRPPVAEVLAQAAGRNGGAELEAIVAAVRSGRDRA